MNTIDYITAIVAVYGAIVASFNWRSRVVESKRVLSVELSQGILVPATRGGPVLSVNVVNPARRPVTLTSITFDLVGQGKEIVAFDLAGEKPLPSVLNEAERCMFWISIGSMSTSLRENRIGLGVQIQAVAKTATGEEFRSESYPFVWE